jgi:phosphoglycerate dehydrogenase-like enzyme
MKKLIIYDGQWGRYAKCFGEHLGPSWIVRTVDDLSTLMAELPGADALLALDFPKEALDAAQGLKLFLFPGAGVLQTDGRAYPAGCAVLNVYEHGVAVAEYVLAAILMHVTGIAACSETFRRGNWTGSGRMGGVPHDEACGKTLGLVGFGTIGQAVAQRALAFGMRVLAICEGVPSAAPRVDFLGGPDDLPLLLRDCDFLVIACPLTVQTRGMIGAAELSMMKPSSFLINVSRAEIIEERALYEALRDRRIAGAALDVWYRYPEHTSQILHGSAFPFHQLPNVIMTPHMAGWTSAMVQRRIARMSDTLKQYERGEPLAQVVLVGAWVPQQRSPGVAL